MKKILIIDDSPLAIAIAEDIIADLNYEVISAISGKEGIELYKSENPDCVLVDLVMPQMDGFTVIKKIIDYDSNANIVSLSASLTDENLSKLENLKIKYFVKKPVSSNKIKQILEKIFN